MNALLERLPHRAPFLFVTEVAGFEATPGREGAMPRFTARWGVRGDEEFLRGHFPGDPIVPGVLVTESLDQTAGLALIARFAEADSSKTGLVGYLVQSDIRFRRPVRPPALINLAVVQEGIVGSLVRFAVEARHEGKVIAEGTLALAVPSTGA
jgi:3-hydroxyacyl-[acyl-carrier-protein] dehydratase